MVNHKVLGIEVTKTIAIIAIGCTIVLASDLLGVGLYARAKAAGTALIKGSAPAPTPAA